MEQIDWSKFYQKFDFDDYLKRFQWSIEKWTSLIKSLKDRMMVKEFEFTDDLIDQRNHVIFIYMKILDISNQVRHLRVVIRYNPQAFTLCDMNMFDDHLNHYCWKIEDEVTKTYFRMEGTEIERKIFI